MLFRKKTYKALDTLYIVFRASPVYVTLRAILLLIYTIVPTAGITFATANFVDKVTEIIKGTRSHGDIYLPLGLLMATLAFNTIVNSLIYLLSSRITLDLQLKLKSEMNKIQTALDYKHIENADSWELISRVSRNPVETIMNGFYGFICILEITISLIIVMVIMVTQVWWVVFIIIAFSFPMLWLSMRAGRKTYQSRRDAEQFNRRYEYLGDILTGRDSVDERTLFGYGNKINNCWTEQYEAGRILQLKVSLRMSLYTKGSSMILVLISVLIGLILIEPVVEGNLSVGMYIGIEAAVFGLVRKLGMQLFVGTENISHINEYMKDLTAFLALSKSEDSLDLPDVVPMHFETLEFRNVRFKYPSGDRYILDGVSFTLVRGKHYAFVGQNGAGKTTITKLLTGLYTEYEGEILINGKELRKYSASKLKTLFSIVYQDYAKYYIPLRENIILGDIVGTNDAKHVSNIAAMAGLNETINELKDGIDTPLGKIIEGGQDISGGQWQRVAIARSLNSRAPIKILDEPTSALDPVNESQVYSRFENLMRGKTTIFISHRLGSTKLADEILVINDGKILERGTHNELMKVDGKYAEMFKVQRRWYQ